MKIFLSAGVPEDRPDRDPRYFETADLIAIRDAVRALATVVVSKGQLIYGGQPAITRLVHRVMLTLNPELREKVTLYQSRYFRDFFPDENHFFVNKIFTERRETREESLELMRRIMIGNHSYHAGVFIGGMDGVEDEFEMFKEMHRQAILIPLASTGGAAKLLYERNSAKIFDKRFEEDYGFMSLLKEKLKL